MTAAAVLCASALRLAYITENLLLKRCYLEVATEPPMDLPISKRIRPYRLA